MIADGHRAYRAQRGFCCDATLASPVRCNRSLEAPSPAPERDGFHLSRRNAESVPVTPSLLAEVHITCTFWAQRSGGGWNDDSQRLVQRLVAMRTRRAPARLRGGVAAGLGTAVVGRLGGGSPACGMQCCARPICASCRISTTDSGQSNSPNDKQCLMHPSNVSEKKGLQ